MALGKVDELDLPQSVRFERWIAPDKAIVDESEKGPTLVNLEGILPARLQNVNLLTMQKGQSQT